MNAQPRKALLDVLTLKVPERLPVWMMRQAGRYLPEYRATREEAGSFLDLCYTPALAEEVTLQPLRRFDFDAAIVFADILLVPHALGQDVGFKEGTGPVLDPIRDGAKLAVLGTDNAKAHLAPVCETLDRLSKSLPDHVALIGFCGAPWTVATYMIEGGTSRDRKLARLAAWSAIGDESHWFNQMLELLVESSTVYLNAQIEAGAEVVQIFETWASDLPPLLFKKYCCEPVAKIVAGVAKENPHVPVIGFPRAAGPGIEMFVNATGVNGLGVDSSITIEQARELAGGSVVLQGNLDPLCLLNGGDVLESQVQAILASCESSKHVFNLGHGILPETPVENVEKMLSIIRSQS
ncbi:MAG: uroporphyrinogen decarboxylase [Hyphomicrobiales bacterium]